MRTRNEILRDVEELILVELKATLRYRETRSSDASWAAVGARIALLPLLQEAEELRDLYLLLWIERTFMISELEGIAHDPDNIKSLRAGIRQVDAALVMLDRVRNPSEYQRVAFYYTLSQDLIGKSGLPKDAAHKFFGSHRTRLLNMKSDRNEKEETALLKLRIGYTWLARKLYIELQQQALAASEVREPAKPYRVERKVKLVA